MAAYIDRDRFTRDLTGETFDFRNHKTDDPVLARGFELPPGSPAWDRQQLWDAVDKSEIATKHLSRTGEVRLRSGAQLAKHYVFALPKDAQITDAQRIEMARQHIQEQFTDNGLACQWAIHMQAGNPHLHALVTTRRLGREGFDKHKATDLNPDFARKNGKGFVSAQDRISEKWEAFQNRYFEERELDLRVDPCGVVSQLHEGKARHIEASWKTAENEARLEDARQTAVVEPQTILEKLTVRQCLFTERELHAVLKKAGLEDMAEREAAKQRVLSCPECVKLYDGEGQETGLYTSTHVRAEERAILELTDRKMREAGGQASEHARRQALSRKTLDPEQREAFDVMTAANRLCVIQGRAGAGKSYTMGAARDAFEVDGWRVVGVAPTNTVSRDMHTDGFREASTVHAELLRQEKARTNPRSRVKAWDRKTVVFVAEAAMLDNRTMHRLLEQADVSGAKVVMIGDDAQLASIQRGGMYSEIRQKTDHALISLVRRQKQDWMRQASMDLADGKIKEAMTAYREHGCIKALGRPIEALLQDWKRDIGRNPDVNRFIYAGINTKVNRINDDCSKIMREMGMVRGGITYDCEKGEKKFQQTIGVGDRIQFNATAKSIDKNLINGNFGTVQKQSQEQIEVKLDSGAIVSFDPQEYKGFALGYAGTVYKGQGKTQTDVYALHGVTWNSRTTYVGATRHKGDFTLYVDNERVKSFEQLTRSMSRSQDRISTLGYLDEHQANQVKERGRDRDGPAGTLPGWSRAEEPSLDAPKPEIDPERLRAARETRERQERLTNPEKAREHIQTKARELRENITARDKHKVAMEKMQPGSLDYRAAVKKLARVKGKVQEAGLALGKSCKELAETLGRETIKAEVAKVLGLEKAGVVMQRCGLEKAVKNQIKGMGYDR
ncbi:AAA family ATPase [Solidesulfovibrio sp.]|uniref:AAA family ATPase n=1 Tax=Solidesulfovibrio sp. TaxID=2910990 RepID=UPI002B220125|nr:AAA family ATPase [Solidesulfovibrio sp.]MEA5089607.1 AAA family ATPase [Solidesulfovibrio sp.]